MLKSEGETIQNETAEQKGGLISMLLGKLAASLSGSQLAGKSIFRASEGTIWADQDFKFCLIV